MKDRFIKVLRFIFKPFFNCPKMDIKVECYDKSIIKMGWKNHYANSWPSKVVGFIKKKIGYVSGCMGIVTIGTLGNKLLLKAITFISKMKFFV